MPNQENPQFVVTHNGEVVQWSNTTVDQRQDYFDEMHDQQDDGRRSQPDKGNGKYRRKKGRGNQSRN